MVAGANVSFIIWARSLFPSVWSESMISLFIIYLHHLSTLLNEGFITILKRWLLCDPWLALILSARPAYFGRSTAVPAYLGLWQLKKGVWHGLDPLPLDSGPSKCQVWWRARAGNMAQEEGACCVSGRYSCPLTEFLAHQCVFVLFLSTLSFTVSLYSILVCTKEILSCLHTRSLLANQPSTRCQG